MLNIEIYQKTLRRMDTSVLSGSKKSGSSSLKDSNSKDEDDISSMTGMIVNLMSTDATRVAEFASWWFVAITAPTELTIGIYFLYSLMGWSCILGFMVFIVILPINHINTKIFVKSEDLLMKARDKRVSLMNEVLQGIRQVKFFAWESNWTKRIMESRTIELGHLTVIYITEVIFWFLWEGYVFDCNLWLFEYSLNYPLERLFLLLRLLSIHLPSFRVRSSLHL
jgi:ABC-type multidrug transport system fused ATPase/permease subunit